MKIFIPVWAICLLTALSIQGSSAAQGSPFVFTPNYFEINGRSIRMVSLSPLLPVTESAGESEIHLFERLASGDTTLLDSVRFVELDQRERQLLFQLTALSESNNLYLFDPQLNTSVSVPVSTLKAIACLNPYVEQLPVSEADYFIGLKLDSSLVSWKNVQWPCIAFSDNDPFAGSNLKNIRWKKCDATDFPSDHLPISADDIPYTNEKPLQPGVCYRYTSGSRHFYIRNYTADETVVAKHLVITDNDSGQKVLENVYTLCESCIFAPDDEQFTGSLFSNYPDVIFGFVYPAYSCPTISIINPDRSEVPVICDNRD